MNGWRLDANHAEAIATLKQERDDLATQVREQSHAVDKMVTLSEAADSRRKLAEDLTRATIASADRRGAAAASSKATNCDGVMRDAWGAK
ncbi:hypothetical protein ACHMW6_06520 [Pseudoduganella sp. UC29_106]|uniref:hypothetical protein n=1 Tax=Pseudoduganella sp. UC29_106 TaxID=3374553 RepID=UPI0037580979